jgi:hypothetical protein
MHILMGLGLFVFLLFFWLSGHWFARHQPPAREITAVFAGWLRSKE